MKFKIGDPVWVEWAGDVYSATVAGYIRQDLNLRKSYILRLTSPRYGKDMMVRTRGAVTQRIPVAEDN